VHKEILRRNSSHEFCTTVEFQYKYSENVHELRLNCRYVAEALGGALEKMGNPHYFNWNDCCKEAIESINLFEKAP